ncbi:hypothetical protein [Mycoplasma zalophidermidis]|nr:hypothetical protein [Mycoplasma zalophidermidis]MCR8966387.1 hypothetical protein [Mycoplasma zalophidermidis]
MHPTKGDHIKAIINKRLEKFIFNKNIGIINIQASKKFNSVAI